MVAGDDRRRRSSGTFSAPSTCGRNSSRSTDRGRRTSTTSRTPRPPSSPAAYGRAAGMATTTPAGGRHPPRSVQRHSSSADVRRWTRQRRQGGASWRCCPARSRSRPTAATVGVLLATASPARRRACGRGREHLAAAGLTVRAAPAARPRHPLAGPQHTRWPDWYAEVERALRRRCAAAATQVFVMGLSMGGTLVIRLAEQRPAEVAGLVLVNPALRTKRQDVSTRCRVLHRFVPSWPGIASDIKKPGVTELAYDRMPLKAVYSLSPALALSRPTWARSPRRCCCSAAGSTTSSSRTPRRLLLPGRLLDRGHRGAPRGHLPRGDAGQRRPGDLRPAASSSSRAHTSAPGREAEMTGEPAAAAADNGLDAVAFVPLRRVDPRVGEHLLDVLGSAGVPAFLEPSADVEPYTRALVAAVPADRPAVGRPGPAPQAREIVDAETPQAPARAGAQPVTTSPRTACRRRARSAAWQAIIAGWTPGPASTGPAAPARDLAGHQPPAGRLRGPDRDAARCRPLAGSADAGRTYRDRDDLIADRWSDDEAERGRRRRTRGGPADADPLPSGKDLDKAAEARARSEAEAAEAAGDLLDRRAADAGRRHRRSTSSRRRPRRSPARPGSRCSRSWRSRSAIAVHGRATVLGAGRPRRAGCSACSPAWPAS